jgi:peptidoglycan hydrolase-like protein with peptidoglycan-binding domain
MRLCPFPIFLFACVTCLGLAPNPGSTTAPRDSDMPRLLSQNLPQSPINTQLSLLKPGSSGVEVEILQNQLKNLGFYSGIVDGRYGKTTREAVSKFQRSLGLAADGIAGSSTRESIKAENEKKLNSQNKLDEKTTQQKAAPTINILSNNIILWSVVSACGVGVLAGLLYLKKFNKKNKPDINHQGIQPNIKTKIQPDINQPDEFEVKKSSSQQRLEIKNEEIAPATIVKVEKPNHQTSNQTKLLPPETTSRLARINIIDELLNDLHNTDPNLRRKAIWDLGQQGDSRAIQPLVEMLIDADSQQRSLILAAISEIGTRALKPMNKALAVSLQDESPQVRQNAIRDITRVYDIMAQISQMLSHALQDSDPEVQETAKYALTQMNRIRNLPNMDKNYEDD